jgi:hypothetical protein
MAQAQRSRTSRSSSTAGEPVDEGYDEPYSDDDLCGEGCFGAGVPEGDIHTVSCEHGKYKVTEATKRQAAPASPRIETVHDRMLHHESEQTIAPDSGAVKLLLDTVNGHSEDLVKLWAAVKELQGRSLGLESGQTEAPAE